MIFFDFEVMSHNWLAVFVDTDTRKETVIVDDDKRLQSFYEANKNKRWVGFNSSHYDEYILKAIICGINPKKVSDFIIQEGQPGWKYSNLFYDIPTAIFDVFTNRAHGLKTLEGFMGDDIRECSIPWDYPLILNEEQLKTLTKYCRYDVRETMKVFYHRAEEFTAHVGLITHFKLNLSHISKTKAQLSARILGAKKRQCFDEFSFPIPDTLKIKKYAHVVEWYEENKDYSKNLQCDIAGVPHVFAWGGIHGAKPKFNSKGRFMLIDVASYYPSLMIRYNLLSRAVPSMRTYKEIYTQRLKYKAEGDPRAEPLKIVLNSTYGAMKDIYNPLYDPRQANAVCISGQLLLLDLIEHLEDYCTLIQSNTDGLIIEASDDVKIKEICAEWEERTGMAVSYEYFDRIYQADVNNYWIPSGGKGAYKKPEILDNDLPIIKTACINYFENGILPEITINNCEDLHQFQKIVKVSNKFNFAVHYQKTGQVIIDEKHIRVFASNDPNDGLIARGKWADTQAGLNGNTAVLKASKFANTHTSVFIDNGDVKGKQCPAKLDRTWYIEQAEERLARTNINIGVI